MTHWIFIPVAHVLKGYDCATHELIFECEAHGEAIGGDGYGHFARVPPGRYGLWTPQRNDPPTDAEGAWFVALDDIYRNMAAYGRSEIGIHGGGTGLPDPLAPRQGWVPTEGCIRLQNEDLALFVPLVTHDDILDCDGWPR